MFQTSRILDRAISHGAAAVIVASTLLLSACGQTGVLYLPTEPAAAKRATLPQSMWPIMPDKKKPAAETPAPPAKNTDAAPAAPASEPSNAPTTP